MIFLWIYLVGVALCVAWHYRAIVHGLAKDRIRRRNAKCDRDVYCKYPRISSCKVHGTRHSFDVFDYVLSINLISTLFWPVVFPLWGLGRAVHYAFEGSVVRAERRLERKLDAERAEKVVRKQAEAELARIRQSWKQMIDNANTDVERANLQRAYESLGSPNA